jgi:hypothetical protein
MTSKQVRTQAAVDIAMSRIPGGQPLKAVVRGTAASGIGQAGAAFGALGGILGAAATKDLYIVLTADWIAVVKASNWSGKPNTLLGCGPRDAGALGDVKYGRGRAFSSVTLRLPEANKPLRLRVHSAWREDLRTFVSELQSSQPVA